MALQNIFTQQSLPGQQAKNNFANPNSYIANYDKYRRYYYRDYHDCQSCEDQQFESIYGAPPTAGGMVKLHN